MVLRLTWLENEQMSSGAEKMCCGAAVKRKGEWLPVHRRTMSECILIKIGFKVGLMLTYMSSQVSFDVDYMRF